MKTIKTTHIGEDYGKVEVKDSYGDVIEYEVPKEVAEAIKNMKPNLG